MNSKKTKQVLLTGGAGFIGSHVAELLLKNGHRVTVLDDLSVGNKNNVPKGAQLIVGNILNHPIDDLIRKNGITDICHMAAKVSIRNSVETFMDDATVNFIGTLRLIKAAIQQRCQSFVMASSMAVYADSPQKTPVPENFTTEPLSPYGVSKLAAEKDLFILLKDQPCRPIALRYFNTYGPRQRLTPYVGVITIFSDQLKKGSPLKIFGDGLQQRDFVSVLDVAWATTAAVENSDATGIFNVGSGKAVSVTELADMMLETHGLPQSLKTFAPKDRTELTYSVADISRAADVLGYEPQNQLMTYLSSLSVAKAA